MWVSRNGVCHSDLCRCRIVSRTRKTEEQLVQELREVIRHAYSEQRGKNKVLIIKAEGVDVSTPSLAEHLESTMQEDAGGATLRYTVLGHVVRGGRPSAMDRVIASRMGQVHLAISGATQKDGWLAVL